MMFDKLILFDIDETLVDSSGNEIYTKDFLNLIYNYMKKGLLIGLASARDLYGTLSIYERMNINGPIIIENGALIYDITSNKKIYIDDEFKFFNQIFLFMLNSLINNNKISLTIIDKLLLKNNSPIKNFVYANYSRETSISLKFNEENKLILMKSISEVLFNLKVQDKINILIHNNNITINPITANKFTASNKYIAHHKYIKKSYIISDQEEITEGNNLKNNTISCAIKTDKSNFYYEIAEIKSTKLAKDGLFEMFNKIIRI